MKQLLFFTAIGIFLFSCNTKNLLNRLEFNDQKESQNFKVSLKSDTIIVGEKGTLIEIRKNAFVDENRHGVDSVDIVLEEFYSAKDFVVNRLSTKTTDGRILRSSGMIHIQAKSNGKEVFMKDDASIKFGFPRVQQSRVANLFKGRLSVNDEMVWDLLEPVHVDTTVIRNETIKFLAYGKEEITITLEAAIIGYDTIPITNENLKDFSSVKSIIYTGNYYDDYLGDTTNSAIATFDKDRFYIFESISLGWINCDIFIEKELFPFIVKATKVNTDVSLILNSLNSVLFPDSIIHERLEYHFSLPKDIPISVSAYAKENGIHYYDIDQVNSLEGSVFANQVPWDLEKIKEAITALN